MLLWWASAQQERLSRPARKRLVEELREGDVVASAISAWEIALLVRQGRITLSIDVGEWLSTVAQVNRFRFVPVDVAIATESVQLPGSFHRDPADRMIVATARRFGATLITRDQKIIGYPHVITL